MLPSLHHHHTTATRTTATTTPPLPHPRHRRKIWGKKLSQDPDAIAFYKHSDNAQRVDLMAIFSSAWCCSSNWSAAGQERERHEG
jgi:hypothetical protein